MNGKIQLTFLLLIIVQAVHSIEEFAFEFYERFPPMRFIYQDNPSLARPAFAISNIILFITGWICFYYWIRPARKGAKTVIRIWFIVESFNVVAHLVWAALTQEYNPGLITVILFVPVLAYLWNLMRKESIDGIS